MESGDRKVRNALFGIAALAAIRLVFNVVFEDSLVDAYVDDQNSSSPEALLREAAPDYMFLGIVSLVLGVAIVVAALLYDRGARWAMWVGVGVGALLVLLNLAFILQPATALSKILGLVTAVAVVGAIVMVVSRTRALRLTGP